MNSKKTRVLSLALMCLGVASVFGSIPAEAAQYYRVCHHGRCHFERVYNVYDVYGVGYYDPYYGPAPVSAPGRFISGTLGAIGL